ncbi:putative alliinase, pyridoxal phosphate-dependent transferase, small domain-containing protein [Helianthus annuus]|nr:putative alliinase, pyridoxal phosphate-dependent transferase, small domain-containing protein [Helianthus annuus]
MFQAISHNSEVNAAYAWIKCEREEDDDCGAVLEAGKIRGRSGRHLVLKIVIHDLVSSRAKMTLNCFCNDSLS